MNLYFVRHGQSQANILMEFSNRGFKHPLTEKGIQQSLELAQKLRALKFEKIFSSPIQRAIQTTLILCEELNMGEFEVNYALKEYDVGILEGKSDEDSWKMNDCLQEKWENPKNWDHKIEGGESYHDITCRFSNFLNSVTHEQNGTRNYLFVGHGGLFVTAIPYLMNNIDYSFTRTHHLGNTEMVIVEKNDAGYVCRTWGTFEFTSSQGQARNS